VAFEKGQFIKTAEGVCRVLSIAGNQIEVEWVHGVLAGSTTRLTRTQLAVPTSRDDSGYRSIKGGKIRPSSGLFWFTGFAVARQSRLWFFVGDSVKDMFLDEWRDVYGVPLREGHSGVTLHSPEHDKQGVQGRVIFKADEREVVVIDSFLRLIVLEDATDNTRVLSAKSGGSSNHWNVNSTALLWFWGREFGMRPPVAGSIDVVRARVIGVHLASFEQGVEYGLRT